MRPLASLSALLGLTAASSVDLTSRSTPSGACNNSPNLCAKTYDSVVHLGAHNSPFVRDASTGYSVSGNQYYNSTVQLSAGVRLLTGQVHKTNSEWHLCHTSCDLIDAGTLSSWLISIKHWLDANPNDVITILLVNSDNATPSELDSQFTTANITSYAYKPPVANQIPSPWPTLQSLITANKRLMVFIATIDTTATTATQSYLMNEFTFIFENNYDNSQISSFACEPNRPSGMTIASALSSNRLPFMNHFLYQDSGGVLDIETPAVANITSTNSPSTSVAGSIAQSAANCTTLYNNRPPTFILVDFFDEGPAIQTVDKLNGVSNAVGRTTPPAKDSKQSAGGSGRADSTFLGVSQLADQVRSGGQTPKKGAWIWASGKWSFGGINLSGGSVIQ